MLSCDTVVTFGPPPCSHIYGNIWQHVNIISYALFSSNPAVCPAHSGHAGSWCSGGIGRRATWSQSGLWFGEYQLPRGCHWLTILWGFYNNNSWHSVFYCMLCFLSTSSWPVDIWNFENRVFRIWPFKYRLTKKTFLFQGRWGSWYIYIYVCVYDG